MVLKVEVAYHALNGGANMASSDAAAASIREMAGQNEEDDAMHLTIAACPNSIGSGSSRCNPKSLKLRSNGGG